MSDERKVLKSCLISGFADEIDESMDKQIEVLNRLGISWIEFRSGDGINVAKYTLEQAQALKEKLDANGIRVSALGSPIGKINIEDEFEPHLEKLEHVIKIAKILGTSYIRMFSFYMPKDKNPADYKEEVFKRTAAMIEMAKEHDMVLLHENEKDIYGDVASRCLELQQEFAGPNYGCTFDFANFVQCGQNTLEAYEMLKPYITYVHIKDAEMESGDVVPPGEGDGNMKEIFRRLDAAGYTGFLSMEPHLADFAGLKDLEQDVKARGRSDQEQAFELAYTSLEAVLRA